MNFAETIYQGISKLSKDKLRELCPPKTFSSKATKMEIVQYVQTQIKDNKSMLDKIYQENISIFAVHPSNVEKILNITSTQRKYYVEHELLKVVHEEDVTVAGNEVVVKYIDLKQVESLLKNSHQLQIWEQQRKNEIKESRKKGAKKAEKTKCKNNQKRSDFKSEFKNTLGEWNSLDCEATPFLELAFWTMWVSRWAKAYQIKVKEAQGDYKDKYREKKEELYTNKNEAIKLLSKSPYAQLSFYKSSKSSKIELLDLCEQHNEERIFEKGVGQSMTKWEYYYTHKECIDHCNNCQVERDEDYYSLFYLEIKSVKIPDIHFSFHTPYSLGKDIFPNPKELPAVEQHKEQEGMFRFGRSLDENEKIIYTEKYTLKCFDEALNKCREVLLGIGIQL